jgi:hypothetical protein
MKFFKPLFYFLIACSFPAGGYCEDVRTVLIEKSMEQKIRSSQAVTEQFLKLLDEGKYDQSWDQGSHIFQNTITKKEWNMAMKKKRIPLGSPETRTLVDIRTATSPKNLPVGEYMVFFYNTVFSKKPGAHELVTLVLEKDDKWHVLTYEVE